MIAPVVNPFYALKVREQFEAGRHDKINKVGVQKVGIRKSNQEMKLQELQEMQ